MKKPKKRGGPMLRRFNPEVLREAISICQDSGNFYFSIPLDERVKTVSYIYRKICDLRTMTH